MLDHKMFNTKLKKTSFIILAIALLASVIYLMMLQKSPFYRDLHAIAYTSNPASYTMGEYMLAIAKAEYNADNVAALNEISSRKDMKLENMAIIAAALSDEFKEKWLCQSKDEAVIHSGLFALTLSRFISTGKPHACANRINTILEQYGTMNGIYLDVYVLHAEHKPHFESRLIEYIEKNRPDKSTMFSIYINHKEYIKNNNKLMSYFKDIEAYYNELDKEIEKDRKD
jgi:hypothetical protein